MIKGHGRVLIRHLFEGISLVNVTCFFMYMVSSHSLGVGTIRGRNLGTAGQTMG